MTPEEPVRVPADSLLRRVWALPLLAHAGLLLVVLLAVLVGFMQPTSAYTSDEGAYALQAVALQEGRWSYDHRLAEYDDAEGSRFPLVNSDRGVDGWYAYTRHPLWPSLLAVSGSVFGDAIGFHLPSLLGAVGAACAAWCLAGALDRRAARPAFWLLAGGPVLAHGFLLWAHAPFAAVTGLALVLALRLVRDPPRPATATLCGALLAGGVLLRSEGTFVAAAVGVVVGLAVRRRGGWSAGIGSLVAIAWLPAVSFVVERAWVSSILGSAAAAPVSPASSGSSSYFAGRISGALNTLLSAAYVGPAVTGILALMALLVPGLAVLALRRGGPAHDVVVGLAIAAVLLVARLLVAPTEAVPGLLPAWPLVFAALAAGGAVAWRGDRSPIAWVCVLVLLGVLATTYPEGGGLEWGGRFLAALWVPLAALAAAGVATRWGTWEVPLRRAAVVGAVTLGAATALLSLVSVGSIRARHDALVTAVESTGGGIAIATVPSVPRLAWRTHEEVAWLRVEPSELSTLTRRLAADGVDDVVVVSAKPPPPGGYGSVRAAGEDVYLLTDPGP